LVGTNRSEFIAHCDGLLRLRISFNEFLGKFKIFLVDTGCTNSIVKRNCIVNANEIREFSSRLRGVGGFLEINGLITINWMGKSTDFYVAEDLPIGVDGFLGAEFLKTYNAKIDYEHNTIRFKTGRMCKTTNTENFALFTSRVDEENQPELIFPVSAKDNSYSFVAPARCEIFKKILTNLNTDCVIRKQEVANGVYVAETIVRPRNGEIFVKILNTRNEEVK
jgi:hypothetical protein